MAHQKSTALRNLAVIYLISIHCLLLWLIAEKFAWFGYFDSTEIVPVEQPGGVSTIKPAVLDTSTPIQSVEVAPSATPTSASPQLIIPVEGVRSEDLIDTFSQTRGEERIHEATDIPAPAGTPVKAASDGEIVKFHDSQAGGISIYQISADRRYFFYYAHLQSRSPAITEKQFVSQGTVIGYVGDTGNAGAGNFHLHFAISHVQDPERWWEGPNINPFPVLKGDATLP